MGPYYRREDDGDYNQDFSHLQNSAKQGWQAPAGFTDPSKLRRGKPGSFVDQGPGREFRPRSGNSGAGGAPHRGYGSDYGSSRAAERPERPDAWGYDSYARQPPQQHRRPSEGHRAYYREDLGKDGLPRVDAPQRLDRLDAFFKGRFKICEDFLNSPEFRSAVDKHAEEQALRQQFSHLIAYTNRVPGCKEELDLAYTATNHAAWNALDGAPLSVTWWNEDGSFQKQDSFNFMSLRACMMCQVDQSAGSGGPMKKGWCLVTDPVTKRHRINKDLFWSTCILWLCTRSAGTYWWDRQFETMVRNVEALGQKTHIHRWRRQHRMGLKPHGEEDPASGGHMAMDTSR